MSETTKLAGAIQERRKLAGLTQAELAEAVGFSVAQIVSDIERGQREVKAWELVKIARALGTSVDRLLGLASDRAPVRVMWRRGSGAACRQLEELFLERAHRFALLERWNDLPAPPPFPRFELDSARLSYPEVARLADTVGKALDLGRRPAASLSSVLQEAFRVKLFYAELGPDESAASAIGDFGCAVLMNAAQAPWRRNYNLAHEIFHLVTWNSAQTRSAPDQAGASWLERVEKLANAFASHLLLPAEEVETQYEGRFAAGEISYPDLVEMAREFEVSTEALVWRLRLMGKLTQERAEEILADPDFREEDRRSMLGHWGPAPEGPLPPRFWRLALSAYRRGQVSLGRLAEMLEVSVSEVGALALGGADGYEAATAPA